MRCIGPDRAELRPPRVVKGVDQRWVAAKRLGSRDILDPMPFPQPIRPAEGRDAAFRRHASAGQDDEIAYIRLHRARLAEPASLARLTPAWLFGGGSHPEGETMGKV